MEILSKNLLEVKDFTLKIEDRLLLDNISFKIKRDKKTAIIGKNGCGKTMLLKEIIKDNNKSIKINSRVKIGYFDQSQDTLNSSISILENIKKDSSFDETFIRINLSLFGFKGDSVYNKVENLSGGEKVKVALCKIILEDNNLLILDEPTNYLDINAIEALEDALKHVEKSIIRYLMIKNLYQIYVIMLLR
ncbi:ABC transporter family protein [[Clostridium] sordellii ATCC 9714]|nr:ABC transporter family protein [[Clostridium] sordellii ATCC 9714] [Paeniclostridium sordellii ATCC 9714]